MRASDAGEFCEDNSTVSPPGLCGTFVVTDKLIVP